MTRVLTWLASLLVCVWLVQVASVTAQQGDARRWDCPTSWPRDPTEGFCIDYDPNRASRGVARELRQWRRQCAPEASGSEAVQACMALGDALRSGRGTRPDRLGAATAFMRACTLGQHEGCRQVARMRAEEGPAMRGLAAALLEESCRAGHARSCETLAEPEFLDREDVSDTAVERVVALLRGSCSDALVGAGCVGWAMLLERGRGVPIDRSRAQRIYASRCDGEEDDSLIACRRLLLVPLEPSPERVRIEQRVCTLEGRADCQTPAQ